MQVWIARDKTGVLVLSTVELYRDGDFWNLRDDYEDAQGVFAELDQKLFPEITWESEPVEFTLTKKETQL